MGRILAIDYGEQRVGVAVSDELRITAQGLPTVEIRGSDKNFFREIKKIVEEKNVDEIVIGYPKNMDGTLSEKARKVDSFIPRLLEFVPKVEKWDERLSTVASYGIMRELGISQKKKNTYADKLAAVYILQGYMARK